MIRKNYDEKKRFDPESNSLIVNPKPALDKLIGKPVSMRVQSGSIFEGTLTEVSRMCDLTITNARELVFGKVVMESPSIRLLRNDVIYVRGPKPEASTNKEGDDAEVESEPSSEPTKP